MTSRGKQHKSNILRISPWQTNRSWHFNMWAKQHERNPSSCTALREVSINKRQTAPFRGLPRWSTATTAAVWQTRKFIATRFFTAVVEDEVDMSDHCTHFVWRRFMKNQQNFGIIWWQLVHFHEMSRNISSNFWELNLKNEIKKKNVL